MWNNGCCILPYCPDGILNSSSHERPDGGRDQKLETRKWRGGVYQPQTGSGESEEIFSRCLIFWLGLCRDMEPVQSWEARQSGKHAVQYKCEDLSPSLTTTDMAPNLSYPNLTIDIKEINRILRSLNKTDDSLNQTIEHNLDLFNIINFSIEGIFLPLLCLIGLAGNSFHSAVWKVERIIVTASMKYW